MGWMAELAAEEVGHAGKQYPQGEDDDPAQESQPSGDALARPPAQEHEPAHGGQETHDYQYKVSIAQDGNLRYGWWRRPPAGAGGLRMLQLQHKV